LQSNKDNDQEPETSTQEPASNKKKGGVLDFLLHPYESKIPPELEQDIYAAEANTPAARDRGQRVALYAALALGGILCAFFNGFLTELRAEVVTDGGDPLAVLDDAGFGWVTSNFLLSFLFTNKIGGVLCLLGGGAAGLLAEAEYDTRRINAENIFAEMQRRRAEKERGASRSSSKKKKAAPPQKAGKKKRLSGKEQKRLSALSEVVLQDDDDNTETATAKAKSEEPVEVEPAVDPKKPPEGILGKIQSFYEKADNMAASQALLLNKKLEDEGLIEKITDESGFKVIGKEEAAKRQQQQAKTEEVSSSETNTKKQ